ncbi:MAG: aspartyl protease family protein [Acidobacteria bacterium]|nr:aspartyl protease family protein [Acidobacteriota bacterium]MCA1637959.1 aspartyl protease family protein [Acidobacteriota bacterium]
MFLKNSFCKLALVIAFSIGFVSVTVSAQTAQPERRMPDMRLPGVSFPAGKSFVEVPFEVESNLMVIPVSVNDSRPLRYVLDTGAQGTSLHNSEIIDSLNLNITGTIPVRGAGGGVASEVSITENVNFNIGGIELSGGRLAVRRLPKDSPFFASFDGVIGRVVFSTLVVAVDWEQRVIKFYEPAKYKYSGKGTVLPITFDEGIRPYITANVVLLGDKPVPVKLVVDTGASHALSLEVGTKTEIKFPEGAAKIVLGRGGSGEITGYAGRVKSFELGGQTFNNVPTSFPDESLGVGGSNGRNGNLGSGLLRRFKVIYDYSRKQMIVEPNKFAGEPFGTAMPSNVAANTVQVSPAALQDYVGKYGNKEINVRDGGLYYQRIGGRGAALRATGKDKFALNNDAQITFVRDGKAVVSEMLIEWVDRDKEQLKRELLPSNQPNNQSQVQQQLSEAEREVKKLERKWLDAYEKYDAEAMNRIVSDDFKLTFSNGSVQTKADILAQLKSAQDANRPSPKFSTEDVQSRVEGDTVILTGRVIQQMTRDGQTRMMQMRYTDTYAKRQGRWQVIASQLTRIQPQ